MSLVVPSAREVIVLTDFLTPALTIRLYGNDRTPAETDVVGDYTEIAGGGYTSFPLVFANWGITAGDPSEAIYNTVQNWIFTAAINAPGTIYGYFVTKDLDGSLMWAERFPSGSVPFEPIAGSNIRVTPRITCE